MKKNVFILYLSMMTIFILIQIYTAGATKELLRGVWKLLLYLEEYSIKSYRYAKHTSAQDFIIIIIWKWDFPMARSVRQSVDRSFIISLEGESYTYFHITIGALVFLQEL